MLLPSYAFTYISLEELIIFLFLLFLGPFSKRKYLVLFSPRGSKTIEKWRPDSGGEITGRGAEREQTVILERLKKDDPVRGGSGLSQSSPQIITFTTKTHYLTV